MVKHAKLDLQVLSVFTSSDLEVFISVVMLLCHVIKKTYFLMNSVYCI